MALDTYGSREKGHSKFNYSRIQNLEVDLSL